MKQMVLTLNCKSCLKGTIRQVSNGFLFFLCISPGGHLGQVVKGAERKEGEGKNEDARHPLSLM